MTWGPYHRVWHRPIRRKRRWRCLHCELLRRRNNLDRVPIYAIDRFLDRVSREHDRLWRALKVGWCPCKATVEMLPSNSPHLRRIKRERLRA